MEGGTQILGMTPEQIKQQWNTNRDNVSGAGTQLHYEIECFHNDRRFHFIIRIKNYMKFIWLIKAKPLQMNHLNGNILFNL